jgi:hypothetical protein
VRANDPPNAADVVTARAQHLRSDADPPPARRPPG